MFGLYACPLTEDASSVNFYATKKETAFGPEPMNQAREFRIDGSSPIDIISKNELVPPGKKSKVNRSFSPRNRIHDLAARISSSSIAFGKSKKKGEEFAKPKKGSEPLSDFEMLIFEAEEKSHNEEVTPERQNSPEMHRNEKRADMVSGGPTTPPASFKLSVTPEDPSRSQIGGLFFLPPLTHTSKLQALKKSYGNQDMRAEVYLLPGISNERCQKVNLIVKNYLEYAWEVSVKPQVSLQCIESRVIQCCQDEIHALPSTGELSGQDLQNQAFAISFKVVLFIQNSNVLLQEILLRLAILRTSLQLQLLLLECQTAWTLQLYRLLDQLTMSEMILTPLQSTQELIKLNRFVELLDELIREKSDEHEQNKWNEVSRNLILQAFGETSIEIQNMLALLHKWMPSDENFPKLIEEVRVLALKAFESRLTEVTNVS